MPRRLVLASTSIYRQELLSRLGHLFEIAAPETNEVVLPGESPLHTALRLSEQKAKAVSAQYPDALIIGSDQVAHMGDIIFGKPGNHDRASQQLRQLSGNSVNFISGVSVYDSANQRIETRGVVTKVTFRQLSESTIQAYLQKEQPFNCAGSAKSEGLGIALIARMECDDPTALIGLPLIALCDLLKIHGVSLI